MRYMCTLRVIDSPGSLQKLVYKTSLATGRKSRIGLKKCNTVSNEKKVTLDIFQHISYRVHSKCIKVYIFVNLKLQGYQICKRIDIIQRYTGCNMIFFHSLIYPAHSKQSHMWIKTNMNLVYLVYQDIRLSNKNRAVHSMSTRWHMKSLFPKPLTSTHDMLLICIIDFLLQLK